MTPGRAWRRLGLPLALSGWWSRVEPVCIQYMTQSLNRPHLSGICQYAGISTPARLWGRPFCVMDSDLLHILQHSLGLDLYGQPPENYQGCHDDEFPGCYRNRFVTSPTSPDGVKCEQLVAGGLMARPTRQPGFIGDMVNYFVTQAGYEAVRRDSPRPPKVSKAKRRWQAFREFREAYQCTFKEYLKWPGRAEYEQREGV